METAGLFTTTAANTSTTDTALSVEGKTAVARMRRTGRGSIGAVSVAMFSLSLWYRSLGRNHSLRSLQAVAAPTNIAVSTTASDTAAVARC